MQRKILPLLDEYFFEDWEGIRSVLGDSDSHGPNNFVHKEKIGNETLYYWNTKALTNPQAYTKLYLNNNVAGDQDAADQ
jgi:5-methylcytosine-specific restriction protein B